MSARQRNRIRSLGSSSATGTAAGSSSVSVSDESGDDSEAVKHTRTTAAFALLDSSDTNSDSESDSESDSDSGGEKNNDNEPSKSSDNPPVAATKEGGEKEENDMDYLDRVISENLYFQASTTTSTTNDAPGLHDRSAQAACCALVLPVDAKDLDIEAVMRRRFGAQDAAQDAAPADQRKGKGRHNRATVATKKSASRFAGRKFIFGAPSDEWSKPPAYIGGGIRIALDSTSDAPVDNVRQFSVDWSPEFEKIHEEFIEVQNSGDPNRLVMFLNAYPYHVEGFLQLAMVFARTGHMDRAAELVKRSLYCLECAFSDAFKPQSGLCRLRIDNVRNTPMFVACFRHMQMSAMLGCPTVSASIARMILSMDPSGDPYSVLLLLDHYLLAAAKCDTIFQMMGISDSNASDAEAVLSACAADWPRAFPLGDKTIGSLPNWSFAVALAFFYIYGSKNTVTVTSLSLQLLEQALLKWPFVLELLLDKCDAISSSRWKAILNKPFFATAASRVNRESSLYHIAILFVTRNGSLWKRDEVMGWLLQAAERVLTNQSPAISMEAMELQCDSFRQLAMSPEVNRYLSAVLEDFQEEFNRLPPEANPLDPMLADPRVLQAQGGIRFAGGRRGRRNNHMMGGDQQQVLDEEAILAEFERLRAMGVDVDLGELAAELQRQHQDLRFENIGAAAGGIPPGNLDPNLPMMQLFLQLLLPWNRLNGEAVANAVARADDLPELDNVSEDDETENGHGDGGN